MKDPDLYSDKSDREGEQDHEESDPEGLEKSEESDSDTSERQDDSYIDLDPNEHLRETPYLEQSQEELGEVWNRGWGWVAAILLSFERQQEKALQMRCDCTTRIQSPRICSSNFHL